MNGSHKDFIRTSREVLGLSQADFATRIGYSVDAVQSWELGRRNPSKAVIFMIDAMLKENVENL